MQVGLGFPFFFILSKIFLNKVILIYHSHNVEYDIRVRNKSSVIITLLTKYFEKLIFKYCNYSTVVSLEDKNRVKSLYKEKHTCLKLWLRLKVLKQDLNYKKIFYVCR